MSRGARKAPALCLAVVQVLAGLGSPADAAPRVALHAGLRPNRLGASTTVSLGFRVATDPHGEPPALSGFALRLPPGMGFAASTLGLATCSTETLLSRGGGGCPRESVIGFGSAQVEVPFDNGTVREAARVSVFMARPTRQRTTTLFYFDGRRPVIAPLVLRSEVFTPSRSPDSVLRTPVPAIPSAPEGPEARVVALRAQIGPRRLRYFRRVHHRVVAYRPRGLSIPSSCPRGGFVFRAAFRFRDGSSTRARSAVPCPARTRGGRGAEGAPR